MFRNWMRGGSFLSVVVMLAITLCATGYARDIYVAPDGQADGVGSMENPIDIETAIGQNSPARPGDTLLLMGGTYEGRMRGIERIPFSFRISGTEEEPIVIKPVDGESVHLNGTVTLENDCNYVHIIGLQIGDLNWDRFRREHRNDTAFNAHGGRGSKLINCNIFGGSMGSGIWRGAIDFKMYGSIIHDYGTIGAGRGHGHAVYTQNEEGTKHFENNVFYRGCGWNFNIYTEGGFVRGYDVINNISFIGGYYAPDQVSFSYGLSGLQPSERIRFIGNVAYQPRFGQQWRGNFRLIVHRNPDVTHRDAEIRDNYIMGGYRGFSMGQFEEAIFTGNTIWSHGIMGELATGPGGSGFNAPDAPKPDLDNYEWDNNIYYDNGVEKNFRYGGGVEAAGDAERITFAEWQALGLDVNSEMRPGRNGKPTGAKVFVFPNSHEQGRANVAVYNWDGLDEVAVDLSEALEVGQKYRVYNLFDVRQTFELAEPVVEAEFDGEEVSLPMKKDEASPDFDAFIVLPVH